LHWYFIILTVGLFTLFHSVPRYTSPTSLGITRPTLILVPLFVVLVGLALLAAAAPPNRILPPLCADGDNACDRQRFDALFARPARHAGYGAHLCRVLAGYPALLLSLMQIASFDILERIRSERELAQLNEELEGRVLERD